MDIFHARSLSTAPDDLENLSEEDLKTLQQQFERLRKEVEHGTKHTSDAAPAPP